MEIISTLIVGLIVGAIAKFLMPGNDPGGWIVTILLGIAGSFVGTYIAGMLGMAGPVGWIGSILGAMLLLFVYRLVKKS
ncbi:MAG: GlsB/YeaQ/YmgE family stress response membrane protein [Ketobacter sp.]